MKKQLAVLFPSIGYHADRPLLYYSAKLARAHGCEVTSVQYPALPSGLRGNPEQIEAAVQTALSAVEPQLEAVLRTDFDRIFFFSKSIGTAIAARYAVRHGLHPGQVYFTPIEAALPDLDPAHHSRADRSLDAAALHLTVPSPTADPVKLCVRLRKALQLGAKCCALFLYDLTGEFTMKILHTTPSQDGFYMPAEFAPHESCLMIWSERADS